MELDAVATIRAALASCESDHDRVRLANALREEIAKSDGVSAAHPVGSVRWVPLAKVQPNDYNPNTVARAEMGLLATSIRHDGYTQPVVTVYDPDEDRYVIVDGFHRYFTMKHNPDILGSTRGYLPVVVIDKTLNERMAATVRHNRARGKHTVSGMSNLVFSMLDGGWDDADICNEVGLSPEELLRLKHITGFSKLFADETYHRAWVTDRQAKIGRDFRGLTDR